jgi:hypothetical protein
MRSMRPIHRRHAAAAAVGSTALAALAALAAGPGSAGAASAPSAQSEYQAALKAVGTQGVHFSSAATQGGVTIHVDGDTGSTSGSQTLTVKRGSQTEQVTAMVSGSTGYLKANATALHNVIGLTNALSRKYAGTWLSFPTTNSALGQLVGGLLNSQVPGELQLSGPYTYGTTTKVNGQQALAVHGFAGTQSGAKVPVVLYVPSTGAPLPIEEVTNPGKTGGATAIHGTVTFSQWGQKTSVKIPAKAVSLLKLVPGATSGATSTTAG